MVIPLPTEFSEEPKIAVFKERTLKKIGEVLQNPEIGETLA